MKKLLIVFCLIAFTLCEDCMIPCEPGKIQCRPAGATIKDCECCPLSDPYCCKKLSNSILKILREYDEKACKMVLLKEYPNLKDVAQDATYEEIRGILAIIERVTDLNKIVKEACSHKLH